MNKVWRIGLPLATTWIALYGCGRKEKHERSGPEDAVPVSDGGNATSGNEPKAAKGNGDAIPNDGSMVALRDGEEYLAHLLNASQLKREELGDLNTQTEVVRLIAQMPKAGGGVQTFTNGHLVNASKIAFRVCDAWMKKAAEGHDDRFTADLPWKDGGAADKLLVQASFTPVFQSAFWGPNLAEQPSATDVNAALFPFNEGLGQETKDPTNDQTVPPLNFINSAVANCIVFAIATPSWFL